MPLIDALPVWAAAAGVFLLRITDVSLGTFRTVSVVQGRVGLSVLIGFFEVLIWVLVVSQVIVGVRDNPVLLVAYAAGFSAGNAVGITLERNLAAGSCVLRMIASNGGEKIADALRAAGYLITTFDGKGRDGVRTMLFTSCPRRELPNVLRLVGQLDPRVFYTVERFSRTGYLVPLPDPTGWRAVFKKK